MATKDLRQEDRWISVSGMIVDTNGKPIPGVHGALLRGFNIEKVFVSSADGTFVVEGQGCTCVALSRVIELANAVWVLQSEEAAVPIPDNCGREWTMVPFYYRQFGGRDCLEKPKAKMVATSCGVRSHGVQAVGLDGNQQPKEVISTNANGTGYFDENISAIAPAASYQDDQGITHTLTSAGVVPILGNLTVEAIYASSSTKKWIVGLVVTDCGEPIPDVCVLLLDANKVLLKDGKTSTDADGAFRFDVEGEYVVFGSEHRDAC